MVDIVHGRKRHPSESGQLTFSQVPAYVRIADELEKILESDIYNTKWYFKDRLYIYVRIIKDLFMNIKHCLSKVVKKIMGRKVNGNVQYNWDGCINDMPNSERKIEKLVELYNANLH